MALTIDVLPMADSQAGEFPKLMVHSDTGTVILAAFRKGQSISGTVLSTTCSSLSVGKYSGSLMYESFVDYHGEVVLKN